MVIAMILPPPFNGALDDIFPELNGVYKKPGCTIKRKNTTGTGFELSFFNPLRGRHW